MKAIRFKSQAAGCTIGLALFTSAEVGMAQSASLEGIWAGTMTIETRAYEVMADFSRATGSWRLGIPNNRNPCSGRDMPISVTSVSESEFKVAVEASKALQSCTEYVVNLRLTDPKTLEGEVEGKGHPVKLVRK